MKTLPLNLSKFRKMKSDDNTTTFRHHEGHEITVAHKKLSGKFREQLDKLPTAKPKEKDEEATPQESKKIDWCKCDDRVGDNPDCTKHEPEKLARGGTVHRYAEGTPEAGLDIEEIDPDSPEAQAPGLAPDEPVQQQPAPQRALAPPAAQAEPPADPAFDPYAPSTPVGPENTAGQQAPVGPPVNPNAAADAAWEQDLKNGHITPKTYGDLFAEKGTLGKIGTIFGLMLGGAGSGLTGQPNVLLGMMKEQIDRDFEAQKKSKDNAHNFLRIQQGGDLNVAQIKKMQQDGLLTEAEAQRALALADIDNHAQAQNKTAITTFQKLADMGKSLDPNSPQGQKHAQMMSIIYPQMNALNSDVNARAEAAKQMLGGLGGSGDSGSFQRQNDALFAAGRKDLSERREERNIRGVPGQATRNIPQHKRDKIQAMQVLDDKGKDLLKYIKSHKGTWLPAQIQVGIQKAEEMKNFYNDSIDGGALTEGRLAWYDKQFGKEPTSFFQELMGGTDKFKEIIDSNARRREMELHGLGLSPDKPKSLLEGTDQSQYKTVGGVKYKRGPNGKAVKVE